MEGERSEAIKETISAKFERLYGLPLEEIDYDGLPEWVAGHLEVQSQKFIVPDVHQTRNFSKLFKFTHPNGDTTYLAEQTKTYGSNEDTEQLAYLIDTHEESITGYIEVRMSMSNTDEYFVHKPLVGITRTFEEFQKQGLGRRRLEEANAFSIAKHGYPLNSDTLITENAARIWERLITDGLAEKYKEGNNDRYRFLS